MAKSPCEDRKVVHVNNRLHSFEYGPYAWYEASPADSLCYFGLCNPAAYNDWLEATDKYIFDVLKPHYTKVKKRADAVTGGGTLPMSIADRFKQVDEFFQEWDAANFQEARAVDGFFHPLRAHWRGKIEEVVKYFDRAACLVADLNDIAENALDAPNITKRRTPPAVKPPPSGDTWLGNPAGGSSGGTTRTGRALGAVGLVALGAAGYFGYKVLTE